MAEQKIYYGTVGPFLYEDTDLIEDADGDFAGETYEALVTSGQLYVATAPTKSQHVLRKIDILNILYPVGSVYISATATSPATLFGGTWVAIEGRFIATYKNGDPDFGVAGATGGAKTSTHDNNHIGTAVSSHSGTAVASHADHVHTGPVAHPESANIQGAVAGDVVTDGVHGETGGATTTLSHSVTQPVDHTVTQPTAHSDHSTLPPFKVYYAWERTA